MDKQTLVEVNLIKIECKTIVNGNRQYKLRGGQEKQLNTLIYECSIQSPCYLTEYIYVNLITSSKLIAGS
jgi:hypothetical protein